MHKVFLSYFIGLIIVFSAGCTTTPTVRPKGMLAQPADLSQEYGYIAGSINATTEYPGNGTSLDPTLIVSYLADDSGHSYIDINGRNDDPIDFENEKLEGRVFAIKVPAGKYAISHVFILGHATNGDKYSLSDKDVGVHFEVKPNEVSYLGAFLAKANTRKGVMMKSQVNAGTGYLAHSYNLERDLPLITQKYINVRDLPFLPINDLIIKLPLIGPGMM